MKIANYSGVLKTIRLHASNIYLLLLLFITIGVSLELLYTNKYSKRKRSDNGFLRIWYCFKRLGRELSIEQWVKSAFTNPFLCQAHRHGHQLRWAMTHSRVRHKLRKLCWTLHSWSPHSCSPLCSSRGDHIPYCPLMSLGHRHCHGALLKLFQIAPKAEFSPRLTET